MPGPLPGFVEQVYEHGWTGRGRLAAAGGNDRLGVTSSWSTAREFPYFFEWLNLREGDYAVGLEPPRTT